MLLNYEKRKGKIMTKKSAEQYFAYRESFACIIRIKLLISIRSFGKILVALRYREKRIRKAIPTVISVGKEHSAISPSLIGPYVRFGRRNERRSSRARDPTKDSGVFSDNVSHLDHLRSRAGGIIARWHICAFYNDGPHVNRAGTSSSDGN